MIAPTRQMNVRTGFGPPSIRTRRGSLVQAMAGSLEGVILDAHAVSLWGVEVNYPGSDNSCLTEVASELLPEALDVGRTSVARMCSALIGGETRQ